MSRLRGEEKWAAACIQASLPGVTVNQHDDGSRQSMYDLVLIRDESPFGCCEVTAVPDAASTALWNELNAGERWIEPDLVGGWLLTLKPGCLAKELRRRIPGLLRRLESGRNDIETYVTLQSLGVLRSQQGATNFPGSIYTSVEPTTDFTSGNAVGTADRLVEWFNDWVRRSEQADNLHKLRSSGLAERHLFVIVPDFTSAPYPVCELLAKDDIPLPLVPPKLPNGITHLWFMSTWHSGPILHWAPGWTKFRKIY